jgi:transposase InsO family protein
LLTQIWYDPDGSREVASARKMWKLMHKMHIKVDGQPVARCTIERLMREFGLFGARRGDSFYKTTGIEGYSIGEPNGPLDGRSQLGLDRESFLEGRPPVRREVLRSQPRWAAAAFVSGMLLEAANVAWVRISIGRASSTGYPLARGCCGYAQEADRGRSSVSRLAHAASRR